MQTNKLPFLFGLVFLAGACGVDTSADAGGVLRDSLECVAGAEDVTDETCDSACNTEPFECPASCVCTDEVEETADGEEADKVTVCHIPPGNPDNAHTITVGAPALDAHLGHGDTQGACPGDEAAGDDDDGEDADDDDADDDDGDDADDGEDADDDDGDDADDDDGDDADDDDGDDADDDDGDDADDDDGDDADDDDSDEDESDDDDGAIDEGGEDADGDGDEDGSEEESAED